ncbi:MAG: glycosyltransferase [Tepidisphaeraceae bacterium]|jgi:GT2 family glycosyltransferase
MFSVIVCSIDSKRFASVKAMYEGVFHGVDWELVGIHDARSLAEGYTRGIAQSKGDKLIFSHDDIDIFSPDAPRRLERHLSNFDIVGIAGTTLLKYAAWAFSGPPYVFGQMAGPGEAGKVQIRIIGAPFPVIRDIQAIDGVFMAARRSVFPKITFDAATFDGFHLYDLDFSYCAFRAGLRLAVVNDICIYHASGGKFDQTWSHYAEKFYKKWLAGAPRVPQRPYRWSSVTVANRMEALEVMIPPYWRQQAENQVG